MKRPHSTPSGEVIDQKIQLFIFGVFLAAIKAGTEAAAVLTTEAVKNGLDSIQLGLTVAMIGIFAHLVHWKSTRFPKHLPDHFSNPEGYVKEVIRRTWAISLSGSLVMLSILGPIIEKLGHKVPTQFFIEGAVCFMAGIFSLSFLYLYRRGDDDPEEFDLAEAG